MAMDMDVDMDVERWRANASSVERKKGDAVCRSSTLRRNQIEWWASLAWSSLKECVCNSLRQARRAVLGGASWAVALDAVDA